MLCPPKPAAFLLLPPQPLHPCPHTTALLLCKRFNCSRNVRLDVSTNAYLRAAVHPRYAPGCISQRGQSSPPPPPVMCPKFLMTQLLYPKATSLRDAVSLGPGLRWRVQSRHAGPSASSLHRFYFTPQRNEENRGTTFESWPCPCPVAGDTKRK